MKRYETIYFEPQRETWIVLDNLLDGYVIAECSSAEEAESYIKLRESQDKVNA